jgi:hypothetical protein
MTSSGRAPLLPPLDFGCPISENRMRARRGERQARWLRDWRFFLLEQSVGKTPGCSFHTVELHQSLSLALSQRDLATASLPIASISPRPSALSIHPRIVVRSPLVCAVIPVSNAPSWPPLLASEFRLRTRHAFYAYALHLGALCCSGHHSSRSFRASSFRPPLFSSCGRSRHLWRRLSSRIGSAATAAVIVAPPLSLAT